MTGMTDKRFDYVARNSLEARLEDNSLKFDVEAMLAGIMEAIDADFTNFIRSWNIELTHVRNTTESDITKNVVLLLQDYIFEFSYRVSFLNELFLCCNKTGLSFDECEKILVKFNRAINMRFDDFSDEVNGG